MHVLLPFIGKDDCEGDDGQTELSNKVDDEKVINSTICHCFPMCASAV